MSVLRERPVETSDSKADKKVAEVLVRWVPENQQVADSLHTGMKTICVIAVHNVEIL